MHGLSILLIGALLVVATGRAEAGLGSLLTKGFKTVSSKVQKAFGKTASKPTAKAGSRAAKAGVSRTATATGAKVAGRVGRSATSQTTGAASRAAANASNTVLNNLGMSGGATLSKLNPDATVKLAEVSYSLARSPHKAEWLRLIGKHGGACVDFLWDHKKGLAIGTAATAVILKPGDFLNAMGGAVEAGVNSAGEFVAKPLIDNAAEHVAKPMAISAAASSSWHPFWNFVLIVLFVVLAAKFHARKRYR